MKYTWEESDIKAGVMFEQNGFVTKYKIIEAENIGYIILDINDNSAININDGVFSNESFISGASGLAAYLNLHECIPHVMEIVKQ